MGLRTMLAGAALAAALGMLYAPAPTDLKQFQADGTTPIPQGGVVTGDSVKLQAKLGNGSTTGQQKLRVEVKPVDQSFTGEITEESEVFADGTVVTLEVTGLAPGDYKWRAWGWCT
jgi:hypothetical protein